MKKIFAVLLAGATLTGCHYLGEPEAYTVVDEERATIVQPVIQPQPMPTPMPAPVVQPMPAPVMAPASCGCATGQTACQVNPGVAGPITLTIPAQTICVQ